MTFHVRHLMLGLFLTCIFEGGIESSNFLPFGMEFLIIFLSTFIFLIFLHTLFTTLTLWDIFKTDKNKSDDIYLYLRKMKKLPLKKQVFIYGQLTITLALYVFAMLESIEEGLGSTILKVGICLSIFGCSYLYYKTRRSLLLSLMEQDMENGLE